MGEPTEADFDALWLKIKARHDAENGEGDAERRAQEAAIRFGIGVTKDGHCIPTYEFFVETPAKQKEG